jgi:Stress responsive A/B Barrel Domain
MRMFGLWCAIGLLCAVIAPMARADDAAATKLYHVVSIKFKKNATPEQIKTVEEAFVALKDKIPGVESLTWGTNVSPENRNNGFTHCFVLTFNSEKNRDAYLEHPEHKAFGKVLGPVMDDVMVIDFWAGK